MCTAIHYDDPEPMLTDAEVRELQRAWDAEDRSEPETWVSLWGLPLALLAFVLLWTLIGGLFINWVTR